MKFFAPYSYGFATRAKTPAQKLSLAAIFALPLWFACSSVGATFLWLFPRFALALTALYSLYEAGYIHNDVYATRREKQPNYRIDGDERALAERLAPWLMAARALTALLCLLALALLGGTNTAMFCLLLLAMSAAFLAHNMIRSRKNIVTYFVLVTLKYIAVPLLFIPSYMFSETIAALVIAFPLIRSIEHAGKPKYGIRRLSGLDWDALRVRYYAVATVVFALMRLSDPRFGLAALLCAWFFAYRAAVLAALGLPSLRAKYRGN